MPTCRSTARARSSARWQSAALGGSLAADGPFAGSAEVHQIGNWIVYSVTVEGPILCLPSPQDLQSQGSFARSACPPDSMGTFFAEAIEDPLILAQRLALPALSIIARWDAVRRSVADIGPPPRAATDRAVERQLEYDDYFGVLRLANADPLVSLSEATVVAYYRLIGDSLCGHSLSEAEFADLHSAFAAILCSIAAAPAASLGVHESPAGQPAKSMNPLRRWKLGHHVFFILIQALIVAHERLAAALARGYVAAAQAAFALLTCLLRGTVTAFRYTADFTSEDYEHIVRPTMAPPFLKDGFTGFFSADHVYLLRCIKLLRLSPQTLNPELGEAYQLYLQTLDTMYEAHAYVCERFVGPGKSLKSQAQDALTSAPTILRNTLKPRALKIAGAPPMELPAPAK